MHVSKFISKSPKGYNFYGHFSSEKIFSLISSNASTHRSDPVLYFIEPSPLLLNHHALVLRNCQNTVNLEPWNISSIVFHFTPNLNHTVLLVDDPLQVLKPLKQTNLTFILCFSSHFIFYQLYSCFKLSPPLHENSPSLRKWEPFEGLA